MSTGHDPFEITQLRVPQMASMSAPLPDFFGQSLCQHSEDPLWDWEIERETRKQWRLRISKAQEVCAACPIMASCREYALSDSWASGVWGGEVIPPRRRTAKKPCTNLLQAA